MDDLTQLSREQLSERIRQTEERTRQMDGQAAERFRQMNELRELTTLEGFLRNCHTLLYKPLKVEARLSSTRGSADIRKWKYRCPTQLR